MRGFQIWSLNWNRIIFDPVFGQKNCWKRSKTGKIAKKQISDVFGQKRGQMLCDFNFDTRFFISVKLAHLYDAQNLRKLKTLFFNPYSTSKASTNFRGSLHLTDRAQISYTVFWYHKATFKTLTQKMLFTPPYCTHNITIWILHPWSSYAASKHMYRFFITSTFSIL